MTELFNSDRVKYLCSCGYLRPLCRVYFCRHCMKLRCGNCVSHEVDSTYCTHCLEMMSIQETSLKKNRCATCKDCPSCGHTLSTRATSIQAPSTEDPTKLVPKKVYYLACGFCRWTSRDSGLPDQNVASGTWTDFENPDTERLNTLLENYRALALLEKKDKEQSRYGRLDPSRKFLEGKDKYGVLARTRKQAGLPPSRSLAISKDVDLKTLKEMEAQPMEDAEPLPDGIFTEPLKLTSVTTMDQRLMFPECQTCDQSSLQPQHKHAELKRSLRCRHCDHNLSKPEFSVISIKFRIQLNAYYHLPDVRIQSVGPLLAGQPVEAIITFCNPTIHAMPIRLESYRDPDEAELKEQPDPDQPETSLLGTVTLERVEPDIIRTADLDLPETEIVLAPRDDSAEFDDTPNPSEYQDDPQVVAWRQANKVAVRLRITPHQQQGVSQGRVIAPLMFSYRYTNTIITAEAKLPQLLDLRARLLVDFGQLQTTTEFGQQ